MLARFCISAALVAATALVYAQVAGFEFAGRPTKPESDRVSFPSIP